MYVCIMSKTKRWHRKIYFMLVIWFSLRCYHRSIVSICVFLSIYRCVQRNGVFRQAMLTAQRHGGQTAQSQDEKPSGSDHEDDKPLDVVGGGDPDSPISAHHHHHHQSHQPGKSRRIRSSPDVRANLLFFFCFRLVVLGIGGQQPAPRGCHEETTGRSPGSTPRGVPAAPSPTSSPARDRQRTREQLLGVGSGQDELAVRQGFGRTFR